MVGRPKTKNPDEVANSQLHVNSKVKDRILAMRKGGDFHNDVVLRLLACWDEHHGENSNEAGAKI